MDVSAVTALVKELNQANSDGNTEDVMRILGKLKAEVTPTEDVLRASKAGVAVGKLRTHATPGVSSLAKEVVKLWKDAVEESKKRRKRDDGDEKDSAAKRVKREDNSSNGTPTGGSPATAASPDVQPKSETKDEVKPKTEKTDSKDIVKTEASSSATTPTKRPALSTIDSSRTVPRTAKSDGSKISARDNDGEDVRDKCAVMIYDALAGDSTAEKKILVERAVSIEWAAFQLLKASTGNDYRAKMRSLFLNLKDKGNPALRNEIVLGYISADKVVNMTKEEMASESVRALNEKIASDNLFKAKAVGETQAETDAFKCGRCQQRKCTYYQMQTRSADEPMTTFVSCTNCGNRWKFS